MLQVPELKRAMGLTHLKDHRGEGVKFELENGTRRDKIKVLGNGVCAPVMRAVVGSLIGGSGSDLLEEDLRPRISKKTASRRGSKKPVRH
jgi:DNA (cytosine-5)-methyltransferase 1